MANLSSGIFLSLVMVLWTLTRSRGFQVKKSPNLLFSRHQDVSCSLVAPWTHVPAYGQCRPSKPMLRLFSVPSSSTVSRALPHMVDDTDSFAYDDDASEDTLSFEQDSDTNDEDESDSTLLEECELWIKAVKKTVKAMVKKKASLQSEWEKAQSIEQTVARAQLIVSNLYMFPSPSVREATVQDWENEGTEVLLKLDPQYESASAEADALFERARKLKRGSKVIQELLQETERAFELLNDATLDLESAVDDGGSVVDEGRLRLVQDRLLRTAKQTKFQLPNTESSPQQRKQQQKTPGSSPYDNVRKLKSPGGCLVLVGRNRRGNEYLSFNVARGKDVWMHARGCPGAHVLIQWRRGGPEPTDACWQFAANLAAFYSDARTERKAEVTVAEAKHLLKPRGAPLGALKLREELKVLVGRPHDVPESLKLARDESGQSDEYRSTDKAKHRRHTQQASKQNQAKKRAEQQAKRNRKNRSSSSDT